IATVILIAITLIAAIAIAGFVFGLFGSFTSTAQLSATGTSISHSALTSGTISVQNTGTANANINSVSLTFGGLTCSLTLSTAVPVTAGSSATITLTGITGCATPASGEQFTGSLSASNGGQISFTGTFS
ncbi:MAG: hypothetical protein JRN51_10305, partial [Nitrososphaerota archaeon]|nr:hypothetical protein [Nitrososphaerota archaeon]